MSLSPRLSRRRPGDGGRCPTVGFVRVVLLAAAAALALGACDDDKPSGGADAGADAAALPACRPMDCAAIPIPRIPCPSGGNPTFVCARNTDQRCTWTLPRCLPPGADGAAGPAGDAGGDAPADAATPDGAAADAVAPDAEAPGDATDDAADAGNDAADAVD